MCCDHHIGRKYLNKVADCKSKCSGLLKGINWRFASNPQSKTEPSKSSKSSTKNSKRTSKKGKKIKKTSKSSRSLKKKSKTSRKKNKKFNRKKLSK